MKNAFNSHPYLYLCFFFLGLATNTTGQIFTLPTGSNFYDYLEAARTSSFYSDDDTLEGGFKSQHDRIALQWGSRLYPHGDFMVANRAIIDEELKTKPVSSKSVQTLLSPSVEVRPNPANNWVSFTYTLEGEQAQAVLELRDAAGKTVHQVQLSQTKGEYVWDTRELQSGTYYYSLKTANTNKNGKVVISK